MNVMTSQCLPELWLQILATICVLVSVTISIPVFCFPLARFIESQVGRWWKDVPETLFRWVNRSILIFLAVLPAAIVGEDGMDNLVGFTGAVTTTSICTTFPNLWFFWLFTRFPSGHIFRKGKVILQIVCVCGVIVGLTTTVVGFLFGGLPLFGANPMAPPDDRQY